MSVTHGRGGVVKAERKRKTTVADVEVYANGAHRRIDSVRDELARAKHELTDRTTVCYLDQGKLSKSLDAARTRLDSLSRVVDFNRSHVLTLADEQRTYVDGADGNLQRQIDCLAAGIPRNLWGRLRWLATGR